MLIKQLKKISIFLLLMQLIVISGCATNKYTDGLNASGEYRITDREVLEFNNHVRHMMRLKMKYATIAAYTAGTIAIATATAATVASAGGAGVVAVAALAGTSAFSGSIMGMFNFSDTTMAYQDGVALMESAEAKYFQHLAISNKGGVIDQHSLSIEAANLYSETVGALRLVEKALASRIPTMDEVRQATGRTMADSTAIGNGDSNLLSSIVVVEGNKIALIETDPKKKPTKTINFQGIVPAKAIVSVQGAIVTTAINTSGISAELTGITPGESQVIIIADNGSPTAISVEVSSPIRILKNGEDLQKKETLIGATPDSYKITSISVFTEASLKPQGCTIAATSSPEVKKIDPKSFFDQKTVAEVQIQCATVGIYTLTIKNKFGTERALILKHDAPVF